MRSALHDRRRAPMSGEPCVVEKEQRLSRSLLWRLQRSYFHRAGIDAWRTATVPHYITNNPRLADAYAAVVFGLLRDGHTSGLDPREPFTVIELGAGSGRFGYLFVRAFVALQRRSRLASVPFRYVLTDFTETNLGYLREHPALRPFVEQGVVDFATFDVERDSEIVLHHAGTRLGPGACGAPPRSGGELRLRRGVAGCFFHRGGRAPRVPDLAHVAAGGDRPRRPRGPRSAHPALHPPARAARLLRGAGAERDPARVCAEPAGGHDPLPLRRPPVPR